LTGEEEEDFDESDDVADEDDELLDPLALLRALALGYLYQVITAISRRRTARTTK
jgi:hypothetical protein